jgi:RNA polymerase sigma factor (TIGR02999 family)
VPYSPESATQLLLRWRNGDEEALQRLIPLVYKELQSAAHRCLRAERPDHTLQSADLVHEAYLRMAAGEPPPTNDRAHFLAIAARLMRQILVDYARRRATARRGPGFRLELDSALELPQSKPADVIAIDRALTGLSHRDAQQERIVELRFFGGLTVEETAQVLEVSPSTVKREWRVAKAWLSRELGRKSDGEDRPVGARQKAV